MSCGIERLAEADAYLKGFSFIEFALLFGSVASGNETMLSDVDIGIYSSKEIDLLLLGRMTAGLESKIGRSVDLMILNGLYRKAPALAYEAVSKGELLFCRNTDSLVGYRRDTFLYYIDTQSLRRQVEETFRKRLAGGKFGESNYAAASSTARK